MITCEVCGTLTPKGTRGRAKKFCSTECSRASRRKHPLQTHCVQCGVELEQNYNMTKRSCSRECRNKMQAAKLKEQRQRSVACEHCAKEFKTGSKKQRFCSSECRLIVAKQNYKYQPKTEPKVLTCGWCGEDVVVPPNFTSNRKYHPDCKIQAKRARYRIKTVKRQNRTVKPSRLSADQVLALYGPNCAICDEPIDDSLPRTSKLGLTVDHVIPLSKGGLDTIENMRPAHWVCNVRKGNKLDA